MVSIVKDFIQRNKALVGAGTAVGVLLIGFLAFGVFGIHTAFIDNEVSEAGPFFASAEGVDEPITTTVVESSEPTEPDTATTSTVP